MKTYSNATRINYGMRIIPIKLIEVFTDEQWEEFIEEWLDLKKKEYVSCERFGSAGDKGRDVVAYIEDPKKNKNYKWDCYQCKHYATALTPSQVYIEFGKIIYHSFKKEYPVPQKYYFVSPKDCGTSLSKLLINSSELKKKIKENWDDKCKNEIVSGTAIPLSGDLLKYFNAFDFSIFGKILRKKVVEEHSKHPNHLTRFGGSLEDRPRLAEKDIPDEVQSNEVIYVTNLLDAYNSTGKVNYKKIEDIAGDHMKHLKRAREGFHFAEQLRVLYRDSLPINTFEDFQEEIYKGIINTVEAKHSNGFEKVKAVEDKSQQIQITSNPLKDVSRVEDKTGICHQLSNNGKVNWRHD